MKFIHTADLHLNSRIDSLPTEKAKIRRDEIMRTFERLCTYAAENGVTAVILAGDVFDTPDNSKKVKSRFLSAIKSAPDVDFLFMNGNHDEGQLFDEDDIIPENLKFFGNEWTTFNYGDVAIKGINFTKDNSAFIYDSLLLDKEKKNIVVLHGQTAAYDASDGYLVNLPRLKDKNIDYLALGHIHANSINRLDNRGVYAYCGALDGRGFDELNDKGFYLLDVDGTIKPQFIDFSSRKLYEYTFNIGDVTDFYLFKNEIFRKFSGEVEPSSLIKIIFKGERNVNLRFDIQSLSAFLNDYFFYVKIVDKTELKISGNDFDADKTVRGEFVRKVLSSNLSEELKNKVIMCGLNAFNGEDLL